MDINFRYKEIAKKYNFGNKHLHHMVNKMNQYLFDDGVKCPVFMKPLDIDYDIEGEHYRLIKDNEVERIDNVSYEEYRTPELWWTLMNINNLHPFDIGNVKLRVIPYSYLNVYILRK